MQTRVLGNAKNFRSANVFFSNVSALIQEDTSPGDVYVE